MIVFYANETNRFFNGKIPTIFIYITFHFMSKRKIIATSSLIYANGPVHLGHMVEWIQTDIWVRFQKMRGHEVYYVGGSDTHGTPIMLKAEQNDETPEAMIERISKEQLSTFERFNIQFDCYHSTHSPVNEALVVEMFEKICEHGDIVTSEIEQLFDETKGMFLPDRFVKGTCPRCKSKDQYGDGCEICGATYQPNELIDPVSALSQTKPVLRKSEHYFFKLTHFGEFLKDWTAHHLQAEMQNKLQEWFTQGLADWDISRDAPYFGFKIPGTNKYFYVWVDAPVGYIASFKVLADRKKLDFQEFWGQNSTAELHHFIGKDIMYFHAMFWPALLHAASYRTPTAIHCHGFLTVNGAKMSKSRGTFIEANRYLEFFNPEHLRYYFAAKLSESVEDIDLNFEDFAQRVNSDLVGKFVNIASRSASFITKKFEGRLSERLIDQNLFDTFVNKGEEIAQCYEMLNYNKAMREIMQLADLANQFVDQHQPWALAKEETKLPEVQLICTQALNLFKILLIYLKPVLPKLAENAEGFLKLQNLEWQALNQPLLNCSIEPFQPLMMRVDPTQLKAAGFL